MDWNAVWQTLSVWITAVARSPEGITLGNVAFAMLLGGLIGLERESSDKPAGFRTHVLIAGASTLLVSLSGFLLDQFSVMTDGGAEIRSDPIRVVEAVITGVSVMATGTIFRRSKKTEIQGLTTASSIILCGAIGVCVALGQWIIAVGMTVMALLVLRGLRLLEPRREEVESRSEKMLGRADKLSTETAEALETERQARQESDNLAIRYFAQLQATIRERDMLAVEVEQLKADSTRAVQQAAERTAQLEALMESSNRRVEQLLQSIEQRTRAAGLSADVSEKK